MTERDALEIPEETQVAPNSAMARLRELRQAARQRTSLDLPIPGYDGGLGVRYKVISLDELAKITGATRKDDTDLLIRVHECIVVSDDEGNWEPLEDDQGPLRFDSRLAEFLGFSLDSERKVRECVEKTFNIDLYPLAVGTQAKRYVEWLSGVEREADREALGE